MQALEIDINDDDHDDLSMDDMELASLVMARRQGHRTFSSLSPTTRTITGLLPASRTTPQRQCLALFVVVCGMLFSTAMVYNIFNNAPTPWMFAAKPGGVPSVSELLRNNSNNTGTAAASNATMAGGESNSKNDTRRRV